MVLILQVEQEGGILGTGFILNYAVVFWNWLLCWLLQLHREGPQRLRLLPAQCSLGFWLLVIVRKGVCLDESFGGRLNVLSNGFYLNG